jgi:fibronectin type 3 domain-containing protein/TolB-like protein
MGKRYLAVIVPLFLIWSSAAIAASSQVRVCVFNFGTLNLETSGLGAAVTNMLIGSLSEDSSLAILDRKELEAFLNMNDLQQNDNLDNVVNIGNRLGLNIVVAGTVEKKGSIIMIQARTIQVEQKKPILGARATAVGDVALAAEVKKLAQQIKTAIAGQLAKEKSADGGSFPAPVQVHKKPGNRSIFLSWGDAPGAAAVAGYDVFRANGETGPYSRIAQISKPEYLDETVDKDTLYYYKIRAYNDRGLQSEFSPVVDAKTAITPNPPVILKTEGHAKGIALIWSPGPGSEDPLPLKGYRLYRARAEQGPYREVATIQTRGGMGEVSTTLDRILKVPYLDKGLDDGAEYHYRVTAYNEKDLESGFSRSMKGMTLPMVGSPNAEGELIREIRLTWKPLDSPFIRGYNIYRSTGEKENFTRIKRIDAPSGASGRQIDYGDRDGLKDQTRYYYRITAVEEGDAETSPSPITSAVTRGKPPIPTEFKATGGFVKGVELRWKASTANDVEGYKIYWARDKEGEYAHLKTLSERATNRYTDSSRGFNKLEDGAAYHYRLTTYNRVEVESEATPSVSAVTKPRPSRPSGLQGQSAKARAVPLRWNQNTEKDIAVYHLFRALSAQGEEFERIAKVQGGEYSDQGLKDDSTYLYRLQAEDRDGLLSDFSETVSFKTKPRPARPEGCRGQVNGGEAVLTWRLSGEHDIAHYTVYEKKFFGVEKIATVREPTFSESGPQKGKTKTYVISSTDKDGLESEPGAEIPVTGP